MTLLRIRLFGGLSAIDHRGNALSIGNRKARALIIYLALRLFAQYEIKKHAPSPRPAS